MRTLPLVLVAVAALLSPAVALAGGASAPTARYFVITGLVLGDQKADASGKMGIEGSKFFASVGCNTIGGPVSVDGDTVTIEGSLAMTEMACEGAIGQAEDFFVKVLQHGPFHITATAWGGDGASIMTTELPTGPGPNASGAPDDPVGSSPGPVIVDPGASCPPLPSGIDGGNGSTGGILPPDAGSGSGGSSGSSSGGSAGGGDTGTGSAPSSTAVAGPGTITEEPPTPPDPAASPAPDESPTLGQTEPAPSLPIVEPAPSAIALPDPGTGVEPGSSFNLDPGIGKPIPVDGCERYYAVDQGLGTSGGIPPKAADAAAEHLSLADAAASITPPVGAALLALFVLGAIGARRWWATARR
jgi:hypothetical protein